MDEPFFVAQSLKHRPNGIQSHLAAIRQCGPLSLVEGTVGVRAIVQHLGEAGVEAVVGGNAVYRPAEAVAEAVEGVGGERAAAGYRDQPVDGVIGVSIWAVVEQVAIIIPSIVVVLNAVGNVVAVCSDPQKLDTKRAK